MNGILKHFGRSTSMTEQIDALAKAVETTSYDLRYHHEVYEAIALIMEACDRPDLAWKARLMERDTSAIDFAHDEGHTEGYEEAREEFDDHEGCFDKDALDKARDTAHTEGHEEGLKEGQDSSENYEKGHKAGRAEALAEVKAAVPKS